MRYLILPTVLLAVAALVPAAPAASPFTDLYDLDRLPLLRPEIRTLQVSSYERNGGNRDWGHFVRESGNVRVLADLEGPGVVRRIWSANPSGFLRITLDGAREPMLAVPFTDLFEDKVPGFSPPIAGKSSGGWYSYVPISFKSRCLITVTDSEPFYYQVTWQKTPDPPAVVGTWTPEDDEARKTAKERWSSLGTYPADEMAQEFPERDISLPPNGRWAQPIHGPGTVTAIRFRFDAGTTFEDLRRTILRIQFDGNKPSVETPLADFFGIGFDNVKWKSLALGVDDEGAYCYFRMPFRKSARFEIENQGKRTLGGTFRVAARPTLPASPWGFFHASYRTAVNEAGQHYMVGQLRGSGHIVGVTHSMRGVAGQWFLEGDEKIYRDGEALPSIYGTGTEDYYNCGWYFNEGPVNVATHGCSHKADTEIGAWRMHIPDPIPFTRSLDFRLEHGGTNDVPGSEYASVLYWYGSGTARDASRPLPRGSALMPRPLIAPVVGATEAESLAWSVPKGASAKRQTWQQISPFRGGGRVMVKGSPGTAATTQLEIPFADMYDVEVYLSGVNTSSTARVIIDGKAVGDPVNDAVGTFPIRKVSVGSVKLTPGKHSFGLRIGKGSVIALDSFRVVPRSGLVRDYAVLGPFPADSVQGVNAPFAPDGKAPELSRTYDTGPGTARWRILLTPTGVLDLASTLTPNENVVAYASFAVHSPKERSLHMTLGSDDGVAAWVNGEKVFSKRVPRGLKVDEDRVPVRLREGWNTVLLKVDNGAAAWEVTARIPDPEQTLKFAALAPE